MFPFPRLIDPLPDNSHPSLSPSHIDSDGYSLISITITLYLLVDLSILNIALKSPTG
jgi:hypothetical protein